MLLQRLEFYRKKASCIVKHKYQIEEAGNLIKDFEIDFCDVQQRLNGSGQRHEDSRKNAKNNLGPLLRTNFLWIGMPL